MLEPHRAALASGYRVVLASASPRRKEILANSRLPSLEIVPATCEENLDRLAYADRPWQYAVDTAALKARDVFDKLKGESSERRLVVIGSDTVVALDGVIYGKPKDTEDAVRMLKTFSGKEHHVYSGVCLLTKDGDSVLKREFYESTAVRFASLDDAVIRGYVATGEPMDKAGGYGIQAVGGTLVEGISGDFYNVMGFPLHRFCVEFIAWLKEYKLLAPRSGE